MEFGVRAHDFGRMSASALARTIAAHGFSCAQLAPAKAIEGYRDLPGSEGMAEARGIGSAFAAEHVRIVVLGRYFNPVHPDPIERERGAMAFHRGLEIAGELGSPLVATETGSAREDCGPDPWNSSDEAYGALLETFAPLVDAAEGLGASIGIEPVASHVLNTPGRMRRFIDDLGSRSIRVVFDPVNLVPDGCEDPRNILSESFELFGDRIDVLHAKDYVMEGRRKRQLPAGLGELDYRLVISFLLETGRAIPVLFDKTAPADLDDCKRRLEAIAASSDPA
jgi:L-ribulose-5-phosphate 3-epimerase